MSKTENYNIQYKNRKNVFGLKPESTLVQFFNQIERDLPILDIGAGQGRNSFFLAQKGFNIIALDPSSVAIDYISSEAKKYQLPINSIQNTFAEFSLSGANFSAVLIFGLFQILSWPDIELLRSKIKKWTQTGSLIFITAFSTLDASYQKFASNWTKISSHSFQKDTGEVRTFLQPGQILDLFKDFNCLHHWEGTGPKHHHGDGVLEQHAMVEAVFVVS